jgi:serpin B
MMKLRHDLKYFEGDGVQVVVLPYRDQSMSMVLLLPEPKGNLAKLGKSLTAECLEGWVARASIRDVSLTLPRFKLTAEYQLTRELQRMGMRLALSEGADFSGIARFSGLKISSVVHKAHIEVDEQGTEGTAATAVALALALPKEALFSADRPFLLCIRDDETKTVLFVGHVAAPRR